MLWEIRRTCLFRSCPICSGKIFRYLLGGTYQSDEYGTTEGLKIWDRCEECKEVFNGTGIMLNTDSIREQICSLFYKWEQRTITDEDFVKGIQDLFASVGGWITSFHQSTG